MSNKAAIKAKVDRHREALDGSVLSLEAKDALHKLMDGAENATNGCSDKIQAMTEIMLDFCLMKVDDRIVMPQLMKQVAEEAVKLQHDVCPVIRATLTVEGKKVYPWDMACEKMKQEIIASQAPRRSSTFFTFKWRGATVDAGGWAASIAALALIFASAYYLRVTRESDLKNAIEQVTQEQSK